MLSKEERKERNSEFWNTFRIEMRQEKSCTGRSMNWINYPSDVKDVYIRLEADSKGARFCFEIQPKDEEIRSILWEQMTELKNVMESEIGPATAWNEFERLFNNRNVSRIYWEDDSINFFNESDQPKVINFLRNKLIHFDKFYQEYKDILVALAE